MSLWNDPELAKIFLKAIPLIDVRAQVEFEDGAIPHSVNLPIMVNEERAQVGTCYKAEGQAAAIKLGHELVNGKVKEERIALWDKYIKENPGTQVFCFRGGLRSQITCQWLREKGHDLYPIKGGYKRLRNFFLSCINEAPIPPLYRVGGLTGTGKTTFINALPNSIDLEGLAVHRGSAFGNYSIQPSQVTFENNLGLALLKARQFKNIILEDESATLGKITLPARFFSDLRDAPMAVIRIDHEKRVQNIFIDYVKGSNAEYFLNGMLRIKKRLSSVYYEELVKQITLAFGNGFKLEEHEPWITMLLKFYYDPLYEKDLKRNAHLIVFEGSEVEVRQYLTSL